jgi:C4-dicarboxylate-specific signal transduction histidine kinase
VAAIFLTLAIIECLVIAVLLLQRSRQRRAQASSAAILRALPDVMFLQTREGVYLECHARDTRELMLRREALLGRSMHDVLPAPLAQTFARAFAAVSRTRELVLIEYELPMPEGRQCYEARVVHCDGDRVLSIVRNVTTRKRAEEQLHEGRQRANEEMLRISKLSTLGEFAATIAHELNQPLTAVAVNASVCLRWLDDPLHDRSMMRETLREVVSESKRAGEVISHARRLFRHQMDHVPIHMSAVIRDAISATRDRLRANHVRVLTELDDDLMVIGDHVELGQVLLNLVKNAIEAMDDVEPHARRLSITSVLDGEGGVTVTVRDSGVGLAGADPGVLFNPSYTTKAEGMGMGLSISRSIIEAHGGRIWAAENTPAGTTVAFRIPAIKIDTAIGASPGARTRVDKHQS